jgi:hypothetical protein
MEMTSGYKSIFCLNILITCFVQTALEASSGVLRIAHYFGLRQGKNHSDFASSERSEDDGGLPKLLYCYTGERKNHKNREA